jgi:hypothetical protein
MIDMSLTDLMHNFLVCKNATTGGLHWRITFINSQLVSLANFQLPNSVKVGAEIPHDPPQTPVIV